MDFFPTNSGQNYLVTLYSEKDQAGSFISWLPQPLFLPKGFYDVGLIDLRCYKVPSPSQPPQAAPEGICTSAEDPNCDDQGEEAGTSTLLSAAGGDATPLFLGLREPVVESKQYIYDEQVDLMGLGLHVSEKLLEVGDNDPSFPMKLGFDYLDVDQAVAKWETTSVANNEAEYVIPEDLAAATGFRRRIFRSGAYTGERLVTSRELIRLGNLESYAFSTITYPYTENLITIHRLYKELVRTKFNYDDIESFLRHIEERVKEKDCDLKFEKLSDRKIKMTFTPTNAQEYLSLADTLRYLLGFPKTDRFMAGEHVSRFAFRAQAFSKLKKGENMLIEVGKIRQYKIPLEEPAAYDIPSVIQTLDESFAKWEFENLSPRFKIEDGAMFVENIPDDVSLTLPTAIYTHFGVEEGATFSRGIRHAVGQKIKETEQRQEDYENQREEIITLPTQPTNEQEVLILLDIVENQQVGNRLAPVIQHCQWDINTSLVFRAKPVLFLGLNCEQVSSIRVSLTDAYLKPFQLPGYAKILRLYFKHRFS